MVFEQLWLLSLLLLLLLLFLSLSFLRLQSASFPLGHNDVPQSISAAAVVVVIVRGGTVVRIASERRRRHLVLVVLLPMRLLRFLTIGDDIRGAVTLLLVDIL